MRRSAMLSGIVAVTILATGMLAGPDHAAAAWRAGGTGSRVYAETPSQAPGSRLRLACEDGVKLYLYPPSAWDGNRLDPTFIVVDGERMPATVDGVDDGVVLSDLPGGAVGTTAALRDRMKRGRTLVVTSPAAARIAPAQMTFSLDGSDFTIDAVERACPSARGR